MKILHSEKARIIAAVFILLFSIGLRVNAPNADLPSHLTFSGSILTDEGNQCHNSRSKVLYGEWFPDDWRITNYNPILPWIKYSVFKIFGVGLFQLRLVNYIFAFLTLLFFFLTLKSYFREHYKFALLGLFLLGINFLYVMYNKIGTFETSIIFWMVLILYFIEKYRAKEKNIYLFWAGAAAVMTLIFKTITAYVLPIPLAAYLVLRLFKKNIKKPTLKEEFKPILFILIGMLVLFVPWYLLHYLPNREWIISSPGQFMGNLIFPKSLKMAFNNFLNFPWREHFFKIPVVWLGAILYIPIFFRRLLNGEIKLTEVGFTLYFFAHSAFFSVMTYRPTRYFIPVIPAMVFLTVLLFRQWLKFRDTKEKKDNVSLFNKIVVYIVDVVWLSLASYLCFIPLINHFFLSKSRPALSFYYFVVSSILVLVAYWIKRCYKLLIWKPLSKKAIVLPLVILLVIISIGVNMSYYIQWFNNRSYTIHNMSNEWNEKLKDAYIGGMTAAAVVLGTPHKTLWLYPNFVNWDEHTFDRYPLTHALLGADISREIHHYFEMWPERMSHTKLAKVYHTKNYFLHFYSFQDPYIQNCIHDTEGYFLDVVNPRNQTINVKIGELYVLGSEIQIFHGDQDFLLKPGANKVEMFARNLDGKEIQSLLLFLEYQHPFADKPLRYEGEIFSKRTGSNLKVKSASNHFVRHFSRKNNSPGFLAYGPAVPFARGLIVADYKLEFSNLKTKLRPICSLDIYSLQTQNSITTRTIKPGDIKKNQSNSYRMNAIIPNSQPLEFRVKAEEWADINFDYIDIKYYQGFWLNFN